MTDANDTPEVSQEDYIEQVTTEAKKSFSLRKMLEGRTSRTGKIQIFLDQVDMLRYQTMDATLQTLNDRVAALPTEDPNRAKLLEQHNTLEESYIELRAKLLENSIIIHLRSIPQVTLDAIQSKTVRKWANISKDREKMDNPLTQGEVQIYMQRDHAQGIIRAAIQKIEAADGSQAELPDTIGKDLAEMLSPAEYQRLDTAIQQMVFNDNLGRLATDEPGF